MLSQKSCFVIKNPLGTLPKDHACTFPFPLSPPPTDVHLLNSKGNPEIFNQRSNGKQQLIPS